MVATEVFAEKRLRQLANLGLDLICRAFCGLHVRRSAGTRHALLGSVWLLNRDQSLFERLLV